MSGADQSYQRRILLAIVVAVAATGLLLLWPRQPGPRVNRVEPSGTDVSVGSTIRLHFAGEVNHDSVAAALRLEPPAELQLVWQEQTLIVTPLQPLLPQTDYRLILAAGAVDAEGIASVRDQQWRFTTRGSRLLVVRQLPSGAAELWTVNPADGAASLLITVAEGVTDLAVDPRGGRLLLVVPRDAQRTALELLDLDSATRNVLYDDPAAAAAAPAWSSLDDMIAFERRALIDGVLGMPSVWLTQLDGATVAPLVADQDRTPTFAPVWSPDGNRLALIDVMSQQVLLYTFFTDRVMPLPLTSGERVSWLPDSSAFIAGTTEALPDGLRQQLARYDLADGKVTTLTDAQQAALSPAVAPNTAQLAYIQRDTAAPRAGLALLTDSGPRALARSGDWLDTSPAWSPDGTRLAVVRFAPNAAGSIVVINATDATEQKVFDDAALFAWLP